MCAKANVERTHILYLPPKVMFFWQFHNLNARFRFFFFIFEITLNLRATCLFTVIITSLEGMLLVAAYQQESYFTSRGMEVMGVHAAYSGVSSPHLHYSHANTAPVFPNSVGFVLFS